MFYENLTAEQKGKQRNIANHEQDKCGNPFRKNITKYFIIWLIFTKLEKKIIVGNSVKVNHALSVMRSWGRQADSILKEKFNLLTFKLESCLGYIYKLFFHVIKSKKYLYCRAGDHCVCMSYIGLLYFPSIFPWNVSHLQE